MGGISLFGLFQGGVVSFVFCFVFFLTKYLFTLLCLVLFVVCSF